MQRRGHRTAILDADVTGPSIPKCFGIHGRAVGSEDAILPVQTETGIQLMSVNLLLEHETDPVIWRGPVIGGVVQQFWGDVLWQDVDYMFVDMPPGTGDVALNVFQTLPVDGVIIVTSPQDLVGMVVEKAVKMAQMMNIPIVGLVENMSYLACPDCGRKIYLFGEGKTQEAADRYGLPLLAQMPIDPALAALVLSLIHICLIYKIHARFCGTLLLYSAKPSLSTGFFIFSKKLLAAIWYSNGSSYENRSAKQLV